MFDRQDETLISSQELGTLERLGFTSHFLQQFQGHAGPGTLPGRVARVDAQGCTLLTASGEARARVPKRLARKTPPVVGDWVSAREDGGELRVRRILERVTSLTRRAAGGDGRPQTLAANLDLVMITCGLDRDFNVGRIERWLTLVHEGGARPIVLLTKAGTVSAEQREQSLVEAKAVALEVEVLAIDVLAGFGLDALELALSRGRTLAFVGSSGVGKSTLVNYLSGGQTMSTQSISAAHGKGRHTTSHRELVALAGRENLVIDTPGLREVGLWGGGEGLDATFMEITQTARDCRFSDCAHAGEPGCAVQAAVERGELDPRRLEARARLAEEQEATARRANEHTRRAYERSFAKHLRRTLEAKSRKR
ncbi:EngC-like GTPase [Enhygromyxa salina]|uniref:Small ribosomal subunit biogenesis GTPase RsgA n=1 Tax=Enhygromyxa salina TaxID=215803 RepID=A0A0C1ZTC1_9BACT|nr:ribosome small subunit-dependent GTPase A [Enhygromyxa salina]KIG14283.1 EngC-like GTPase [Enhygromyxa salina]